MTWTVQAALALGWRSLSETLKMAVFAATATVSGYWALSSSLEIISCAAKAAKELRSRTSAKIYVYQTLLERLAQDLQDMAAALGPCIQEAHAVVGQRHLAGHRHVTTADQPRIRNGLVGRATRAGSDQRRAVAGEAGDAVNPRGLNGFGEGHCRQDGGESAGQHRRAHPWGTKEKHIMGRTPASPSALHPRLERMSTAEDSGR
jgi:hypothetical protein